jgi:hypothetical protein
MESRGETASPARILSGCTRPEPGEQPAWSRRPRSHLRPVSTGSGSSVHAPRSLHIRTEAARGGRSHILVLAQNPAARGRSGRGNIPGSLDATRHARRRTPPQAERHAGPGQGSAQAHVALARLRSEATLDRASSLGSDRFDLPQLRGPGVPRSFSQSSNRRGIRAIARNSAARRHRDSSPLSSSLLAARPVPRARRRSRADFR